MLFLQKNITAVQQSDPFTSVASSAPTLCGLNNLLQYDFTISLNEVRL